MGTQGLDMNTIIFIRHGQSESNVKNFFTSEENASPLTPKGISQVEKLAKTIPKDFKPNGLYTSPVLRARQTSKIIADRIGIEPKLDKRLWERNFGELENKIYPSYEKKNADLLANIKAGYTNGIESWDSLQSRIKSFIKGKEGINVAVSHHDLIKSAIDILDDRYNDLDNSILLPAASATVIDFENEKIIGIGMGSFPDLSQIIN